MNWGYMGITQPFETQQADGRNVTIYPNGKIEDSSNGRIIRKPTLNQTPILNDSESNGLNVDKTILIAGMFILGIVAICALSRRG